eukprot:TRINITY_DN1968_c1_g2_i1.p1 TRINITY_DN1968_c1_g2~~TRINITY_DN1968_c1_g2_i1.p1  ORF type:complete len:329 (-),score=148.57 TRINITY_DN1968_c1_g2_i1:49-1035(-)
MQIDNSWCTIESDPGVFTELIEKLGAKNIQVQELYSLSIDELQQYKPIYGLIFLFKWTREKDDRLALDHFENLYFAKQVVNNACATQAILSILLNSPKIEIGDLLNQFKSFSSSMPPDICGSLLNSSEVIKEAHNSFARPEPWVIDNKSSKKGEAFHFISYIPFNGYLFELDGLKSGPILLGECTDENWLQEVAPHIQTRMNKYSSSEIRFNLMAIIKSKKSKYEEELIELEAKKLSLTLNQHNDNPESQTEIILIEEQIEKLKLKLQEEEEVIKQYKLENVRRRHNYLPLIINLLKLVAGSDQLPDLIRQSKAKASSKITSKLENID